MTTRAEVIGCNADTVMVAFYYPVPLAYRQASAADPNREPAGTRLTAQELSDLKAGIFFELVHSLSVRGMTTLQMAARVEDAWTELQSVALARYTGSFNNKGKRWDSALGWG